MKLLLIGNKSNKKDKLKIKLVTRLNTDFFNLESNSSKKELNKIIKTERDWSIDINLGEEINSELLDIATYQANKVIILDYEDDVELAFFIKKHLKRLIIIKNQKEEKILIKAIEEGHEFVI